MPCSRVLLHGIKGIGATDGNQKNEVCFHIELDRAGNRCMCSGVENCAKWVRIEVPAGTYAEGFLIGFSRSGTW